MVVWWCWWWSILTIIEQPQSKLFNSGLNWVVAIDSGTAPGHLVITIVCMAPSFTDVEEMGVPGSANLVQ